MTVSPAPAVAAAATLRRMSRTAWLGAVMAPALATLAGWDCANGAPLPFSVSVNLSALQLARDDLVGFVAGALGRHGLAGSRLTLELTESAIVQDPRRATTVLGGLKALDVSVAMDDFGTGYTSLAYLQRLPIDVLKIDRSFVSGMLRDADSVAIVRAVLSLASALGMATTAEGIDAPELALALADMGCSHGQGFHFARPLEPDASDRPVVLQRESLVCHAGPP